MTQVKMPTSDRWQDALIESLKDPEYAAGFIEAILEEKDPEPQLLSAALKDVIDARVAIPELSQSAKQKYEKLHKILTESGCAEIYAFVELLDALGFKLAIEEK